MHLCTQHWKPSRPTCKTSAGTLSPLAPRTHPCTPGTLGRWGPPAWDHAGYRAAGRGFMVTLCGLGGGRGERVTCCSVEEALLQVHSVCGGLASGTGIKPTCATTPRGMRQVRTGTTTFPTCTSRRRSSVPPEQMRRIIIIIINMVYSPRMGCNSDITCNGGGDGRCESWNWRGNGGCPQSVHASDVEMCTHASLSSPCGWHLRLGWHTWSPQCRN
jgi:hypothetical protein